MFSPPKLTVSNAGFAKMPVLKTAAPSVKASTAKVGENGVSTAITSSSDLSGGAAVSTIQPNVRTVQPTADFIKSLALRAGAMIAEGFNKVKTIHHKAEADLVTEYDVNVENFLIKQINSHFPTHKILAEESCAKERTVLTDDPTWIIDPIDGTTNFVHSFPFVAVSLGYAVGKNLLVGVVYNPILDELYLAEKGKGAFLIKQNRSLNGMIKEEKQRLLRKTEGIKLSSALVATGFATGEVSKLRSGCVDSEDMKEEKERIEQLAKNVDENVSMLTRCCRDIRRSGSAACDLCSVALGRLDAYFEATIWEWDIAAGILICEEANCIIRDMDGVSKLPPELDKNRILACADEQLASEIGSKLKF